MLRKNSGFTLVELLIVVAIIGILAAIAIPQFAAYRAKAYCAAAKSDLANYAIAQEAYFTDYSAYSTGNNITGFTPTTTGGQTVLLSIPTILTSPAGFQVTATHSACAQGSASGVSGTFTWDSSTGGLMP
jgi:prepilin-type N-terminal cleavage/methylation domain-containing protein